jgi:CRP/FNR family transcriptional regulator
MNDAAQSRAPWLSVFPGLAGVEDEAGVAALQAACVRTFAPGTKIVRLGDPCQFFILLVRGTLRVSQMATNGREIVLYRVRAGELCVLTLTNLLAATTYSAGALAEEEVDVVMIPAPKFQEALARSDAFRTFVISTLSRRMGEMLALVEQVAFQRLDLRLACLLGQLFGQNYGEPIEVTHQALALELGSSREVVSRILKEFELLGCIRLRRRMIELLSPETLSRLTRAPAL